MANRTEDQQFAAATRAMAMKKATFFDSNSPTFVETLLRFPTAVKHDAAIDSWLRVQRVELRPLAEMWFARIRQCGDAVRELMHDGCPTACVGDAGFAYVGVYSDHVNVGFFLGALLNDPARLLEGTGRRGRHVKLWPGRGTNERALADLITAAYEDMRRRVLHQG